MSGYDEQALMYFNRKRNRGRQALRVETAPLIEAANGFVEGEDIEVTDATWNDAAASQIGLWTRDGIPFEVASGLTRTLDADDVGKVPGYISRATDAKGTTSEISVDGSQVEAAE